MKITQEEAKSIMDLEAYDIILDVRTPAEFKQGHIKHAKNYAYEKLGKGLPKFLQNTDKKSTILIYCRSGIRSEAADIILTEMGFTNTRDFGGITTFDYPEYIVQ